MTVMQLLGICTGMKFGRYEIVRPLGRGGAGTVYEAADQSLGRRVALKVLDIRSTDAAQIDHATARFLREGRAAAQVQHPHIVDVFDVGVENGMPFLVMELVHGETLAQLLQSDQTLTLKRALEILLPILSAAAELHAAGIVHRDIKPANILLTRGSNLSPKLADFGISRMEDGSPSLTQTDAVMGTPEYMSPEALRAKRLVTERSDQYAIAVILYECTTGVKPFQGESPYELMHAISNDEVVPPSALEPSLPKDLDAIVLRALSRAPEARFRSVEELAASLLPFASRDVAARWRQDFVAPSESDVCNRGVASATSAIGRRSRGRWPFMVAAVCALGLAIGARQVRPTRISTIEPRLLRPLATRLARYPKAPALVAAASSRSSAASAIESPTALPTPPASPAVNRNRPLPGARLRSMPSAPPLSSQQPVISSPSIGENGAPILDVP
jgi:serine/threonine protein kinase